MIGSSNNFTTTIVTNTETETRIQSALDKIASIGSATIITTTANTITTTVVSPPAVSGSIYVPTGNTDVVLPAVAGPAAANTARPPAVESQPIDILQEMADDNGLTVAEKVADIISRATAQLRARYEYEP